MSQFFVNSHGGGGTGDVNTLTGNDGQTVGPDSFGNINVKGDFKYLTVTGNPITFTETISPIQPLAIVIQSAPIDMTTIGQKLLFNIAQNFIITGITVKLSNLSVAQTSTKSFAQSLTIGWTGPNWNDSNLTTGPLLSNPGAPNFVIGQYGKASFSFNINAAIPSGYTVPLPANTNIMMNIITPSTFTTDTEIFFFQGFYV